jgi:murein DD-endopeptidase MepM/ murein hydrolase activator NlpD
VVRVSDSVFASLGAAMLAAAVLTSSAPSAAPFPVEAVVVRPIPLPSVSRSAALKRGETLASLLEDLGLSARDAQPWLIAANRHLDSRALPIGLQAEATIDVHGELKTIRLTPDWRATLVLERSTGGILIRREERPVERQLLVVDGVISTSLFDAIQVSGEEDELALQLADLFQWDIDFHREVQLGDTFALLVERVRSDGRTVAYGHVLAATFVNSGRRYSAIRYAPNGGLLGHYDERGRPIQKQFLRAPLRFSRLTSRFSGSRMHPILGKRLPHWGVDYAAPVGTPIMATGAGTVSFVGVRSGAGNTVEIRHPGGFTTAYLHLSRPASAIRPGSRVDQGQVIGYVGTTGLSTGPHLDYRVTRSGRFVNPMLVGHEPASPLPPAELSGYQRWAGAVLPLLERPGLLDAPVRSQLVDMAPANMRGELEGVLPAAAMRASS